MQKVTFNAADRPFVFKNKIQLKAFIESIFSQEGKAFTSLSYIFCSDDYLLQINKDFLQHDYYTDIITFNLAESKNDVEGEVYISLDRVKDNALQQNATVVEETLRVLFHGVLHLCGYKDKTKKDIITMRGKEEYYIKQYLS